MARVRRTVGLRHPDLVHSGGRGAVFDAVDPQLRQSALPDDDHSLGYTGRPIRLAFGRPSTALRTCRPHLRGLGDQPPVSETATVIPARAATGLSMAIIAAPAFSSGMRSAISPRRSSRPSVIIASMAG